MTHSRHAPVPEGIYFVSTIGEDGQAVFADDSDRVALGELVARAIARCGAQVHAFKWLDDELLLILQVYGVSLAGVMQRITSIHARRVNERLGQKGALFQHPYRHVLLEEAGSVLEALATVHRDPPSRWSSHRAYLGFPDFPWVTTGMALKLLALELGPGAQAYRALIARPPPWLHSRSPVATSAPRGSGRRPFDHFAAWLKSRSRERAKPASLEQLIQAVARWFQVDPAAIVSHESSALLSLARAIVVWYAMQHEVASLGELAVRFDRGKSTLHETREAYRLLAPHLFTIRLEDLLQGPNVPLSAVLRLIRDLRRRGHDDDECPVPGDS
ncbi:MAG TPA: hypothetical protein VHB68_18220 [Steroidobacteraceae bacterium]|nr:hypothetical protein [Steroidobacteraceae bacterium]